ncbi:PilZ domain-containing protein [Teredinibacter waterburyi]|jgi:PilZ domain.|uniref:PilZ domain-containing protein n=1 Tax=Teredinibacter waterburyi TaxID=1500538 RepID=UPI00165F0CD7|nr:PilZ domain-containing protein [Teredinibacter waterburyi]
MSVLVDRRRFTRVQFDGKLSITQESKSYDCRLVDISLNGLLVDAPSQYELNTNTAVLVRIELSDDSVIEMKANLAHSSESILGFKCISIDVESISHLRRLIELNISAPEASERVLAELLQPNEE